MSNTVVLPDKGAKKSSSKPERPPFKVKDLSLAGWGRNEIRLAQ